MGMLFRKPKVAMVFLAAIVTVSCAGKAPVKPTVPGPRPVQPVTEQPIEPSPQPFDPASISEEAKKATFTDVRAFIESMNETIRLKDYDTWYKHLTQEYIDYYSNPTVLLQKSEAPVLKRMGIKLQSLKDYFVYVVYPSRQNDRVDDIEFITERLVKAITFGPDGERQILYFLERDGTSWKIGIGR